MGKSQKNAAPALPAYVQAAKDAAEAATQALQAAEVSLAALPEAAKDAALTVLRNAEAEAIGAYAMAQAQAETEAAQAAEVKAAQDAAVNLPEAVRQAALDAMLAAIASKYAPAPVEPEAAPEVTSGRKQVGARTAERNAGVALALASDSTLRQRAEQTIAAFDSADVAHCTVIRQAGTRYASIVAFASNGAGVANAGDYRLLATAIRLRLLESPYSLRPNGEGTAVVPWLAAVKEHAAGAAKGNDSLRLKFDDRREIALYPDGRFRLALPNRSDVRYIRTDAAALAQFTGSAESAAPAPQTSAPQAPTAPTVQAAPNGTLQPTVACQHCGTRNVATYSECRTCKAEDWNASA